MKNSIPSPPRFYAERDGGPGPLWAYVVDRYADPLGEQRRTDCPSWRAARQLARQFNAQPPWPPWDTLQAARDNSQL
jgi:hypothetical protein